MIKVDETDPVGELEPCFPYRDVTFRRNVDIKEFYEPQTEIGRGKFGTVYRCKERGTGLSLAAKYVATPRREDRRNVEREVDIMRVLQHPRLIQLYDAFDNGKTMCLVLELIEGGELFERVIDDDFVLTERACAVFMRQICEGIDFIHKQNILHLDMKPENILCLTRTGNRIKIIDFGLARKFDPDKKLQVLFGTPEFVAPEVVNFDQIGFGTDMWSVGVICYVLLSGLSPFMGDTDIETMANVTIAKYDFDDEAFDEISTEAKDFIQRLLLKDQSARFTAAQCVAHPWLRRRPPPAPAAPPPAPVVPVVVEAPEPPSPQPLEVTKDNLRGFVERWSEHPNSPYLFDLTCHSISLTSMSLAHQASQQSMRMCTPSPRGSLPSSPDSVIELDNTEEFEHYSFQDQPSTHGRFLERLNKERRASDSSCLPNHAPIQQVSPVNLAEEIRRLSDRLIRMVKEIPTDIVNNNSNNERTQKFRVSDVNSRDVPLSMIQKNEFPPPSSPCTLRSLSSSSGTSQSLPSSPTCRLSPEPTPPSTRELVLHLQQESSSMHNKQQVNSQHCTMRWGQIEISMEHMSQTTIKSMKSIFESSSSEYTSSSSKSNNNIINKKDSQSKTARVPLKLA